MTKRTNKEVAEMRASLQPGAIFETKAGAFGRVVAREVTADGVKLKCEYACKTQVRRSTSELRELVARIARLATAADYAAAVALSQAAKPAKTVAPAALSLRALADRIAALEAQVAELRQQPRNALQVVR